jgi:hypothetical protein
MLNLESCQAYPIKETVKQCEKCANGTVYLSEPDFWDWLQMQDWDKLTIKGLKEAVDYYLAEGGIPCEDCGAKGYIINRR